MLSEIALAIVSLKHQKVPCYIILAREGYRNGCALGKAGQAREPQSIRTLRSCAPRIHQVLLLFASEKIGTVSGFLSGSLIVPSALPWLSEGLFLMRGGFRAGSAEVPVLCSVGQSCGPAGYQGIPTISAEPQGCRFLCFLGSTLPPALPHPWWGCVEHTWAHLPPSLLAEHPTFGQTMQEMQRYAVTCCCFELLSVSFKHGLPQPAVLDSRNLSVFWETVVSY